VTTFELDGDDVMRARAESTLINDTLALMIDEHESLFGNAADPELLRRLGPARVVARDLGTQQVRMCALCARVGLVVDC
jgi:hypothetical protein